MSVQGAEPDIIVVGAGAAGATLAARLSERADLGVLLLEAGGPGRGPLFSVPLMTGVLLRADVANWNYVTEPQARLDGRRLKWPRGRALGGSTAINGMVYMRGLASDFDGWAQRGLPGWGHADVLPAFRRSEGSDIGDPALHGRDGPLTVTRSRRENPLFQAWLDAAAAAGHPATDDFNGATPDGAGPYDFMIRNGRRWSTARAYLDPARGRPNLTIRTRAQVTRVAIENGRAVGVFVLENGRETLLRARRRVVLAGGTINSPQLLMLSGIGPADHLRGLDMPVVADLPGVGANLQDHLLVRVTHACTEPVTVDALRRPHRAALAFLQAWAFGTGPATSFPIEVGGLLKSDPALDLPDLQSAFLPGYSSAALRFPFIGFKAPPNMGHGFFANVCQMRPSSRGVIRLASADPTAKPLIDPAYLSSPPDLSVLREGVKRLREIFAQAPFDRWRGPEVAPGAEVKTDAEIERWIQATADTVYHPVGTCRMGPETDAHAVVDARLRVRGVEGLSVVDASVMPTITSANTAAPTIMIAERAAEFMATELA